jgi:starvation-inducible outer membrane lipoprotein
MIEEVNQETSMEQAANRFVLATCFMLVSCLAYPSSLKVFF